MKLLIGLGFKLGLFPIFCFHRARSPPPRSLLILVNSLLVRFHSSERGPYTSSENWKNEIVRVLCLLPC